jgi:hypothetical protein
MTTYTLTLTLSEARTLERTITIEADSIQSAREQLLALPNEQVLVEENYLALTPRAYDPTEHDWKVVDWEVVECDIEDPSNLLESKP